MERIPIEKLEKLVRESHKRAVGTKWRHYRGGMYVITNVAVLEATSEIAIIYTALERPTVPFVRPISVWAELVDWNGRKVPRFTKIDPEG